MGAHLNKLVYSGASSQWRGTPNFDWHGTPDQNLLTLNAGGLLRLNPDEFKATLSSDFRFGAAVWNSFTPFACSSIIWGVGPWTELWYYDSPTAKTGAISDQNEALMKYYINTNPTGGSYQQYPKGFFGSARVSPQTETFISLGATQYQGIQTSSQLVGLWRKEPGVWMMRIDIAMDNAAWWLDYLGGNSADDPRGTYEFDSKTLVSVTGGSTYTFTFDPSVAPPYDRYDNSFDPIGTIEVDDV